MRKCFVLFIIIVNINFYLSANPLEGAWISEDATTWLFYNDGTVVRHRIRDAIDEFFPGEMGIRYREQNPGMIQLGHQEHRGTFEYNSNQIIINFTRSYFNYFNGGGMTSREDLILRYTYQITNDIITMSDSNTTERLTRAFYTSQFNGDWFRDNKILIKFNNDHLTMFSDNGITIYNGRYFMNEKYICLYAPFNYQVPGGTISSIDNFTIFEYRFETNNIYLRNLRDTNEIFEEFSR
ncbi:MAG: hypothetical protein FWD47_09900 [Treponema sp.]|nr:hypothetical protein [Treponema sp.]